jgi:hypothetical protein
MGAIVEKPMLGVFEAFAKMAELAVSRSRPLLLL